MLQLLLKNKERMSMINHYLRLIVPECYMEKSEILKHVDHTLLKPFAEWEQIEKLCQEAIEYGTASVCVPQCYIKKIKMTFGSKINICTVIGFPLGYNSTESKLIEATSAIMNGANEIDMVINICDVKNGDFDKVEDEIRAIKNAIGNHILKVIVETCYLAADEKVAICKTVTNAGADYIKTSTGFGTKGADFEDVKLFRNCVGENVKIKAAGGIRTLEDMEKYLAFGCDRIGTSSAVELLKD